MHERAFFAQAHARGHRERRTERLDDEDAQRQKIRNHEAAEYGLYLWDAGAGGHVHCLARCCGRSSVFVARVRGRGRGQFAPRQHGQTRARDAKQQGKSHVDGKSTGVAMAPECKVCAIDRRLGGRGRGVRLTAGFAREERVIAAVAEFPVADGGFGYVDQVGHAGC